MNSPYGKVIIVICFVLLFSCNNKTKHIDYTLPQCDSIKLLKECIVDSNFIFETGKLFVNNKNVMYRFTNIHREI